MSCHKQLVGNGSYPILTATLQSEVLTASSNWILTHGAVYCSLDIYNCLSVVDVYVLPFMICNCLRLAFAAAAYPRVISPLLLLK